MSPSTDTEKEGAAETPARDEYRVIKCGAVDLNQGIPHMFGILGTIFLVS